MCKYDTLNFDIIDGVGIVVLNRPNQANGLNRVMAAELSSLADKVAEDTSVRSVVLTGSGRFFCAGGDVKAMAGFGSKIGCEIKLLAGDLHRAILTFSRMNAPIIMAVNGIAAGAGFGLAMSGDYVIASHSASFTMAYSNVGLSPDGGATYFLPRLVGLRRTQELMYENRTLNATEALEWGIATRTVPEEDLMSTALGCASKIANGSSMSHANIKRLLAGTFDASLEEQLALESDYISACAASLNGKEGINAFLEKRQPDYAKGNVEFAGMVTENG